MKSSSIGLLFVAAFALATIGGYLSSRGQKVELFEFNQYEPLVGPHEEYASQLWFMVDYNPQTRTDTWKWREGLTKAQWGPLAWYWLHTLAIEYPDRPTIEDAEATQLRIWNFAANLACSDCANHARTYVSKNPPDLSTSSSLQLWAWKFHDTVDKRKHKKQLSFGEYLADYSQEICRAKPYTAGCRH